MKRVFGCFLLVLSIFFVVSCASSQGTAASPEPAPAPVAAPAPERPVAAPAPAPAPEQPFPAPQPKSSIILDNARTHRVVWGNTLSKIARQYYGSRNGYYYPLIILGNPGIVKNPDLIVGGTRLQIPDLQRNLDNRAARAELKAYMNELVTYYAQKGGRTNQTMSNNLRSLANTL
jgi:phage tail protein X